MPHSIKQKQSTHKLDAGRIMNLWYLPVLITIFIIALVYSKFGNIDNMSIADLVVWALLLLIFAGVFIFLFFNHLPLARETELIMTGTTFRIIQNGTEYSCDRNQITEVIERSTHRLPWSQVIRWTVKAEDREFVISSLIISRLTFESYFWNKTTQVTAFFPVV